MRRGDEGLHASGDYRPLGDWCATDATARTCSRVLWDGWLDISSATSINLCSPQAADEDAPEPGRTRQHLDDAQHLHARGRRLASTRRGRRRGAVVWRCGPNGPKLPAALETATPVSDSIDGISDWRRRPDLNRGWRFCRISEVVIRVVSCWSLVDPASPFCPVFGPYWTTSGLQRDSSAPLSGPGAHAPSAERIQVRSASRPARPVSIP